LQDPRWPALEGAGATATADKSRPTPVGASSTVAPARGLLAVSTWPLPARIVGPLSPRVSFLRSAIRLADHIDRTTGTTPATTRLRWQFAANIPGGAPTADQMSPATVAATG
jgi:hypothetical protein